MMTIDGPTLTSLLPPSLLIPHLHSTLPSLSPSIHSPPRLSYPLSPSPSPSSSLLLMPSWSLSPSLPYIGIKILTSFPSHSPSIHASYSLFSSSSGAPLASLDGTLLTLLRTSSLSALASLLLSPPTPSLLLLAGAGALAPHLLAAHRAARPSLSRFLIWNRSPARARALAARLQQQEEEGDRSVTFEHVEDLDAAVAVADVIVCATGAESPIVRGELLKGGAHLNLVGSFTRGMRECDDEAVRRGRVFVDSEAAVEEAGELAGAIERGVITREDIAGTLADLAGGRVRRRDGEITVFKSVGAAVFDLLAAQLAYENYLKGSQ